MGQESQASSCLSNETLLASRVIQGVSGPLSSCVWNLRVFPEDAWGSQCPFVLCLPPQGCLQRGVRALGSFQERTGKSGSFGMWHHPRGSSRMEAGTSGVLSISDSGRRLPAEYGQQSHASSSVEEWISACLSSCSRSDRPLVDRKSVV